MTVQQVKEYLSEMRLSKFRINHNLGVRVTYLRCSVAGCPYRCRLLENINYEGENIPHFEFEVLTASEHNHEVEVARDRGLTLRQKNIIDLSLQRNQAAPKKVLNFMFLIPKEAQE